MRRVRSHHHRLHYAGLFWSATNSGHVAYESRLELDRLWTADFAPELLLLGVIPFAWNAAHQRGMGARRSGSVPAPLRSARGGSPAAERHPFRLDPETKRRLEELADEYGPRRLSVLVRVGVRRLIAYPDTDVALAQLHTQRLTGDPGKTSRCAVDWRNRTTALSHPSNGHS
ncbi:hypothetical protein [Rhodococcus tibetensis]|uniref:Uncharacterized protein n=1 Tax=Rhodococcus tibetensis TaxID=2965064 RepID=A0ABT1QH73_9NOCA|nr:hypothetical protein [Rhodococcus sp. FXJ9.536]MCQ4121018.1 hypothetical protein [Rhodococcus sp. FXJ9.536]